MVALLLLLAAVDFRFVKDPEAAAWRLLRDDQPVQELPLADCVVYEIQADWRAPAKAARTSSDVRKILYAAFLKKRYGYQVASLNQAYGLEVSAFTELEAMDFTKLDEKRPEVLADDIEYVAGIYKSRIEWVFRNAQGKPRLIEFPTGVPRELANELSLIADAVLVKEPVSGLAKPVVLLDCPAVKPTFATACARI